MVAQPSLTVRYAVISALVMSALVGISLAWNFNNIKGQAVGLATFEAIANWNKDVAFRQWATRHGGLYVRPDKRTPPNPYLSHLPDRDVVTRDGIELTLMNPAYMMRQMTEEFEELYGIKGKITGQVLLNPINKADPWEMRALKLFDRGEKEVIEQAVIEGAPYLRLMRPMVMKEGCVKCHGHLGFKVGDIRGGVSVSIPLTPYFAAAEDSKQSMMISHGGVWFSSLFVIGFIARRSRKQEEERVRARAALHDANENLEKQIRERTRQLRQEIEERKQAQRSVEYHQERTSTILKTAPDGIITINRKGIIESFNPGAEKIFGYVVDEVVGRNVSLLMPEPMHSEHDGYLENYLDTGKAKVIGIGREVEGLRKNGEIFPLALSAGVSNIHGEKLFTATVRDISERIAAEKAILEAKSQAEMANRAKSEFLANMSHELRTPLNAIIGFSDTMKEEIFGPLANEKYEEYAKNIHESGEHLLELINDILDVSAIEAGKLELHEEEIDVANLIETSLRLVRARAKEGLVELSSSVDETLPRLYGDDRRLKQILLNLLSNAVKFTAEKGKVSVGAFVDDDGSLTFIVTDTGIGMTQKEIGKALQPFGQVDALISRKQEGTGLGLTVTTSLVEAHDGTLEITSKPQEGTTVTVRFPPDRVMT